MPSPFYNFDAAIHIGRYLAKNVELTFELRRTFDSGFQLVAFSQEQNVSAEDFGEGSFDKGLHFRIPFDGLPFNSNSSYSTILGPLDRDGGED